MSPGIVVWIAVGIGGLLLLWLPIMMFAALFSGWWELAREFPRRGAHHGSRRGAGSVYLSAVFRYKGIVQYAVDDEFLHLWMVPVAGAFHAPMSLPWEAVHFFRGEKSVLGMVPIEVSGRRMLVSKGMVKHELAVRRAMDALPGGVSEGAGDGAEADAG